MITVVSGFPRSGTTLVMSMLRAAGMPLYFDQDVSWETTNNFKLPGDTAWLDGCVGKAVKILEPLIATPPVGRAYRCIWLDRDAKEQARSQAKLMGLNLTRRQIAQLAASIVHDRPVAVGLWNRLAEGRVLRVRFETLLEQPDAEAARIADFLGVGVPSAMAAMVIPRGPGNFPGFLELSLMAVAAALKARKSMETSHE